MTEDEKIIYEMHIARKIIILRNKITNSQVLFQSLYLLQKGN